MNCDPIARWYRWLEYAAFGKALERRRCAFLDNIANGEMGNACRVLVLGEGDGRFLEKLVERDPTALIDYIDLSGQMLSLARARAGTERVTYHHANALTIQLPAAAYNLLVTHFFLDCLDDRDAALLIARVSESLQPRAHWLISEFREPAPWARVLVTMIYVFFRITTGLRTRRLVDHRRLLTNAGFALVREETARFGLLASELWSYRRE